MMRLKADRKLIGNLIYQMSYQFLIFLYPLIVTPVVSKRLGVTGIGVYSYTFSIVSIFILAGGLGIGTYGNRMVSCSRDDREKLRECVSGIFSVQFFSGSIVSLAYFVFIFRIKTQLLEAGLLQGTALLAFFMDVSWFFSGMEDFKLMVKRNILIKLISFFLIIVFVRTPEDLRIYILIMNFSNLFGQLLMWPVLWRSVGKIRLKRNGIGAYFLPVCRLFLPNFAANSYLYIDRTLLGLYGTMDHVAYYENSDKIIRMPIGLVNAACGVLLPRISHQCASLSTKEHIRVLHAVTDAVLLFIVPVVTGLCCIADTFIGWYLGENFKSCGTLIKMMTPVIVLVSVSSILRMLYFVPRGEDTVCAGSAGFSLFINLLLSICLVRRFGVFGVLAASVFAEAAGLIYLLAKLADAFYLRGLLRSSLKYGAACVPMCFAVLHIQKRSGSGMGATFLEALAGAAVYVSILCLFKLIKKRIKA